MRKIITAILILALAFTLCGCEGRMTLGAALSQEGPAGHWSGGEENIAPLVTAFLLSSEDAEMQELLAYIDLGEIRAVRELTLSSDGSFTLSSDSASCGKATEAVIQAFRAGFEEYVRSVTTESMDELGLSDAEMNPTDGQDMTTTIDINVDELFDELELNSRLAGLEDALHEAGTYDAKNGAVELHFGNEVITAEYDSNAGTLSFSQPGSRLSGAVFTVD